MFSQNQRLFFLGVKLIISRLIQVFIVYCLYCEKTRLFLGFLGEISRPHGARLLTNFESRQYTPVIKQCQLAHLKTTLDDEKFFLLAIKKLRS